MDDVTAKYVKWKGNERQFVVHALVRCVAPWLNVIGRFMLLGAS